MKVFNKQNKQVVKALPLLGLALLFSSKMVAQATVDFHKQMVVVDGHNDVIYESLLKGRDLGKQLAVGHTDIPRLKEGGVDVQVFAVWSDDKKFGKGQAFKHANAQLDALENMLKANKTDIALAKSSADIDRILKGGKIVALIGVEGGNMIENSLENLETLYARGARYLTLTWNYNLPWATAAAVESTTKGDKGKGLSDFGKRVINRMNALGMMVDLSHVGEKTFYDVLAASTKPVLVSHSNAYRLMPHYRNLKDAQLEALRKNGGVVGVNFYSGFLDPDFAARSKRLYKQHFGDKGNYTLSASRQYEQLPKSLRRKADAPLSLLLDHIDYLVKKLGIDHVAVGSDFDGI